jgi:hypothetical protein
MADARMLLGRARALYDDERLTFADRAQREAWRRGFASATEWLRAALAHVRGAPLPAIRSDVQRLGVVKYALCGTAAAPWRVGAAAPRRGWVRTGAVLTFYAVEAQMVFLLPLALDGAHRRVLRESRRWTVRAGGTFAVMQTVIPLAAVMLFGGVVGRGFVRSWCLGCLAVVVWYEDLRRAAH